MDELIKALRICGDGAPTDCGKCIYNGDFCMSHMLRDAADAIERLTEKIEHLQRAYNAVHDDYNMECFAFKFGYLDSAIRDALGFIGYLDSAIRDALGFKGG